MVKHSPEILASKEKKHHNYYGPEQKKGSTSRAPNQANRY